MSTYCTRSDIEDVFGVENTSQYADLDNDENATTITNRITRAIAWASAEIDDFARGAHYTIPLADSSGSTPTTIENLAAVLAGIWLYEARGSKDFSERTGEPSHRMFYQKAWARQMLEEIKTGARKLDAEI